MKALCNPLHTRVEIFPAKQLRRLMSNADTVRAIERDSHAHIEFQPASDDDNANLVQNVVIQGCDSLAADLAMSTLDDIIEGFLNEDFAEESIGKDDDRGSAMSSVEMSTIRSRRHQSSTLLDAHLKQMLSFVDGSEQASCRTNMDDVVKRSVLSVMRDVTQDFAKEDEDGNLDLSCCNSSYIHARGSGKKSKSTRKRIVAKHTSTVALKSHSKKVLKRQCNDDVADCSFDAVKHSKHATDNAIDIADTSLEFASLNKDKENDSMTILKSGKRFQKGAAIVKVPGNHEQMACENAEILDGTDEKHDGSKIKSGSKIKGGSKIKSESKIKSGSKRDSAVNVSWRVSDLYDMSLDVKDPDKWVLLDAYKADNSVVEVQQEQNDVTIVVSDSSSEDLVDADWPVHKPKPVIGGCNVSVIDLTCDSPVVTSKPPPLVPLKGVLQRVDHSMVCELKLTENAELKPALLVPEDVALQNTDLPKVCHLQFSQNAELKPVLVRNEATLETSDIPKLSSPQLSVNGESKTSVQCVTTIDLETDGQPVDRLKSVVTIVHPIVATSKALKYIIIDGSNVAMA